MQSSLFKNLRLQTYLQIINSIIPLITMPYISRVLGANNIGMFSSYHAMASFFTLFAVFGMGYYGTRCIAAEKDDIKRKGLFLELYLLQLITTSIATACYLAYCLIFTGNNSMAFLQLITLFGCFIDISWFYFGIEDFEFTVVVNTLIRLLSVVILFVLVRDSNGLVIYTIIMLGSAFISQLILWLRFIKNKYISFKDIGKIQIKKHIIPNFMLFVPLVAMTISNITDKAMLGFLSTYEQAGFYANTDRIINVPYNLFLGIGTVFLPRMSYLYNENEEKSKEFFLDTLSGIIMLGVSISFGIIAVAQNFIPLFFGSGYEPCIFLVKIFSFVVIIKGISNAIRMHYLVPFKKERIYIIATSIGAIINITLNYLLIPKYGALGAVFTTLVSEFIVLIIQIISVFKINDLKNLVVDLFVYLCIGVIMLIVLYSISFDYLNPFVIIVLDVAAGIIIYCLMTLLYWKISKNRLYVLYIESRVICLISMFDFGKKKTKK